MTAKIIRHQHVIAEALTSIEGNMRVTSRDVESAYQTTLNRLGHQVGMLEALTGVVARRLFPIDVPVAVLAAEVATKLMDTHQIDPHTIDLLINTSVSKDYIEPSMASTVHGLLGLRANTLNFDVSSACLGFLNGMQLASTMIESGQIQRALIVNAENARPPLEATVHRLQSPEVDEAFFRDQFATLTLGSGAVAMVLSHESIANQGHQFTGGLIEADSSHNHLCRGWPDQMKTDAIGLLKAGVALGTRAFQQAQVHFDWSSKNLSLVVMHQVGAAHTRAMLKAMQLPMDKAMITYNEYGNMGPAAIPFTLDLASQQGKLNRDDKIALMGIGSGLNCAMMELLW